ncbi:RRQRL motif-containing zinc-binding protein [Pseudofrankia sp. BMG5.36]|uniref:RRQRL motif-containing zinc-binding protein n=1 Tax=Pseudofrankia sp. BMG5.36 TaxID=1834512 RepID=UPI0008DA8E41|nr:RRQRL motif-containing zinc-binding protein [Pseudofrankia sp. BMG5.36]OHV44901.1 hypothetical protein BCD48_23855 [Pseudofrankia sp. BMG5.36]
MFLDPAGTRYGIPTWPWRMTPDHLATRGQLAAMGLRPTGDPVAQLMWRSRRAASGVRTAALYHLADTVLRTPPAPGRLAQLAAARARRRLCPGCGADAGYVIPARLGVCLDCHDRTGLAA